MTYRTEDKIFFVLWLLATVAVLVPLFALASQ